jgi:hypothetical protein
MDMKNVYQALGWPLNIIALGEDRETAHRIKRLIESAVAAEREACARLCDDKSVMPYDIADYLATKIRERSNVLLNGARLFARPLVLKLDVASD